MKLGMIKTGIRSVVGLGVSYVVGASLKKLEDENASTMQKALGCIGAFGLAWYVSDKVAKFAEEQVDEVIELIEEANELNEEKEA